jgi:ribulose-phosphate 3-epimerase
MSCAAEPPTTPEEIRSVMDALAGYHADHPHTTVPFYLCSDMAHGYADAHGRVVHDNLELFAFNIPWTCEFHIKNTDSSFDATFGFTPQEVRKGIVDLREVAALIRRHAHRLPVADLVGYLEIPGPKLGRDYSDHLLAEQITESVAHIRRELGDLLPD